MKQLIEHKEEKKMVTIQQPHVNQEALNEVAIELLKGNHRTMNMEVNHSYCEVETVIELLVGDGYVVTIKNERIR